MRDGTGTGPDTRGTTRSTTLSTTRSDTRGTTPASRRGDRRNRRRRLPGFALGGLAMLVAAAFGAALLILPIKAWVNQRHALGTSRTELADLDKANAGLQADIDRLKTRAGIAQAAREDLGVVKRREKVYRVLAIPRLTASFPNAWLYPTIKTLMTERTATIGAPPAAAQTSDSVGDPASSAAPATSTP